MSTLQLSLRLMNSISIRLKSDNDNITMNFSYCDLLYARIRTRLCKNNAKYGHYYYKYDLPHFVLYYKGKPLPDRFLHYSDLDVKPGDTIHLEFLGLSGGNPANASLPDVEFWLNGSQIEVEFIPTMSIQSVFTMFGCELMDYISPHPLGIICASIRRKNDIYYEYIDWSMWPYPIQSFAGYEIIFTYQVLSSSYLMDENIHYKWPVQFKSK